MILAGIYRKILQEQFPKFTPPLPLYQVPLKYNEELRYYLTQISSSIPCPTVNDPTLKYDKLYFFDKDKDKDKEDIYEFENLFKINVKTGHIWILNTWTNNKYKDFNHIMEYITDWIRAHELGQKVLDIYLKIQQKQFMQKPAEELAKKIFHPKNISKFSDWGYLSDNDNDDDDDEE
jgi:hypothetical protein